MLEHIPGLPDLILFRMNDVSVIRVSRCGITRGTLPGQHVLILIWIIMTGGSFKIVSNWAVLTGRPSATAGARSRTAPYLVATGAPSDQGALDGARVGQCQQEGRAPGPQ